MAVEDLMEHIASLSSEILDLRIENASLKRAIDIISKAFKELNSEQSFHDAVVRAYS